MYNLKCRGFSLVEIMIVVAIIAVTLVIAVPNLSAIYESNQATTQSHNFISGLQLILSEAENNDQSVSICAKKEVTTECVEYTTTPSTSTWKNGWLAFIDNNSNGNYEASIDELVKVQVNSKNKVSVASPASALTVNSNGTITRGNGDYDFTPNSCSGSGGHRVTINMNGHITAQGVACVQ